MNVDAVTIKTEKGPLTIFTDLDTLTEEEKEELYKEGEDLA